jgi:hypothetical protein
MIRRKCSRVRYIIISRQRASRKILPAATGLRTHDLRIPRLMLYQPDLTFRRIKDWKSVLTVNSSRPERVVQLVEHRSGMVRSPAAAGRVFCLRAVWKLLYISLENIFLSYYRVNNNTTLYNNCRTNIVRCWSSVKLNSLPENAFRFINFCFTPNRFTK